MNRPLPMPTRDRWQPLRAGLVDIFYYDTEEFWFRDGRLLLRGNNGTGKSKVLALTLPFLLDGDLSPHRVEPDADPKKRMEWNLLLGGAHPASERLGYAWLEFGRLDDGRPDYRTVGCGLKAVSGRGIARHWYFTTSRRVGADLALMDATRTALTRDRLVDALGGVGRVHDTAREYRRAVDEQLFGLGEQRYAALVDLLVQLRQPQLSKRPSERALSAALTEALPPLDQAVVADVAEAFRSLEDDRDALTAMVEARDAATSFLASYRRYARVLTRRRAARPRSAQSAYERVNRDLSAARTEYERADHALGEARAEQQLLADEAIRLRAREEALRESPEMRSATELDRARREADSTEREAQRRAGDRDGAAARVDRQRARHDTARQRHENATELLVTSRRFTVNAALAALIGDEHVERVDGVLDVEPDAVDVDRLRRDAEGIVERQQRAIKHVRALLATVDRAGRDLAEARRRVSELDGQADELAERRELADEAVAGHGRRLVTEVERRLAAATELHVADPAAVLEALELWTETLDGPNPAVAAVVAAGQAAAEGLAAADAEIAGEQRRIETDLADVQAEIDRLERGEDGAPPVLYTRDPAVRANRRGAPLWRLVDFREGIDEASRAGIESALEAAGILDAWVTPDGEVLARGTGDVMLRPGDPVPTNLATCLAPAVDREDPNAAAVSDATLERLLAAIGLGPTGTTWVDAAGGFRVGALEGAWRKPAAAFIGRGSREAARRRRLVERRSVRDSLTTRLDVLTERRRALAERRGVLAAEVGAMPEDTALVRAHADIAALVGEERRLVERRAGADARLTEAHSADAEAAEALAEGAHDAGLPADPAALSDVDIALTGYQLAVTQLWPVVTALRDAVRQLGEAADDLAGAEEMLSEHTERAAEAMQAATAARERHATLDGTVGAAVAELERRLAEVAVRTEGNQRATRTAQAVAEAALKQVGNAEGRCEELGRELVTATDDRVAAAESFQHYAATGLLMIALPDLPLPAPPWAPDPAVRLARRVEEELAGVDSEDRTWERAQRDVNTELKTLQDAMSRHGNRATAELHEDGVLVRVEYQGRPAGVPELTDALRTEVEDRERLLNEREREILENHLINEVASTLQELISTAENHVVAMNGELSARPTSTGMRLRLRWIPRDDGPAGLGAARERLLRQTSDAWSEQDRTAVGAFLQAQIDAVRARNPGGTWLEHLTEALDYRGWHGFVIERHQNGQWRSATGPASGGERVLAASVPLFAAASAHYASADNAHAPRLVTLDEAFAGVDDNARAKYLGLLAAFDLDVVMTSEREWGCYAEVPGLAIAQLSRTEDVPAVLVTHWEWDGRRRVRVDRPAAYPAPVALPSQPDGLWS